MSETSKSGSTGKSVRATGVPPDLTMKRSCLPAASHRNAIVLPSGDQPCSEGYLMSAMRSIVMLPRGACWATAGKSKPRKPINKRQTEGDFLIFFFFCLYFVFFYIWFFFLLNIYFFFLKIPLKMASMFSRHP